MMPSPSRSFHCSVTWSSPMFASIAPPLAGVAIAGETWIEAGLFQPRPRFFRRRPARRPARGYAGAPPPETSRLDERVPGLHGGAGVEAARGGQAAGRGRVDAVV